MLDANAVVMFAHDDTPTLAIAQSCTSHPLKPSTYLSIPVPVSAPVVPVSVSVPVRAHVSYSCHFSDIFNTAELRFMLHMCNDQLQCNIFVVVIVVSCY